MPSGTDDLSYSQLLDRITFLASLASDFRVVSPLLDDMRAVTSIRNTSQPLPDSDRARLSGVYTKLEDYLLYKDALRTFTPESLQHLVHQQFDETKKPLHDARWQLVISLSLSVLAYAIAAPILRTHAVNFWWLIAGIFAALTLFACTSWLFLSGYRTFTRALRQAHILFSITAVLVGFSSLLWSITVTNKELFEIPILRYSNGFIGYIFTFIPAYFGVRLLARTVGVTNRFVSPLWVGLWAALGLVICLLVSKIVDPADSYLGTALSTLWLSSLFCGLVAVQMLRISRVVTAGYATAMKYLTACYVAAVIVNTVNQLVLVSTGTDYGIRLVFAGALYIVPGLLMFMSGYLFKLSSIGESLYSKKRGM